jgi:hypothetical protein
MIGLYSRITLRIGPRRVADAFGECLRHFQTIRNALGTRGSPLSRPATSEVVTARKLLDISTARFLREGRALIGPSRPALDAAENRAWV